MAKFVIVIAGGLLATGLLPQASAQAAQCRTITEPTNGVCRRQWVCTGAPHRRCRMVGVCTPTVRTKTVCF